MLHAGATDLPALAHQCAWLKSCLLHDCKDAKTANWFAGLFVSTLPSSNTLALKLRQKTSELRHSKMTSSKYGHGRIARCVRAPHRLLGQDRAPRSRHRPKRYTQQTTSLTQTAVHSYRPEELWEAAKQFTIACKEGDAAGDRDVEIPVVIRFSGGLRGSSTPFASRPRVALCACRSTSLECVEAIGFERPPVVNSFPARRRRGDQDSGGTDNRAYSRRIRRIGEYIRRRRQSRRQRAASGPLRGRTPVSEPAEMDAVAAIEKYLQAAGGSGNSREAVPWSERGVLQRRPGGKAAGDAVRQGR